MLKRTTVMITLWAGVAFAQTVASPIGDANIQFFNSNNGGPVFPCVGCKLYTYAAGTTTLRATYTDSTGGTPNTNPVVMDSAGYSPSGIWTRGQCYNLKLTDSSNVVIWTVQNYCDAATSLRLNLAGPNGAALIGYLPTGGNTAITVAADLNTELSALGFDSFSSGCTQATSQDKTLVISSLLTVGSGTYNCKRRFTAGGKLRFSASSTVVMAGSSIAAPDQYIYDKVTNASVSLTVQGQTTPIGWFGSSPSASTSVNAAAYNAAFQSSINTKQEVCGSYPVGGATIAINAVFTGADGEVSGSNYDGNIGCAETTTTGDGGWVITNAYRQRIEIKTRRTTTTWAPVLADSTSVGIKEYATTGSSENRYKFMAEGYHQGRLATTNNTAGVGFANNIYEYEFYHNNWHASDDVPLAGFTNQETHLGFNARNDSTTCVSLGPNVAVAGSTFIYATAGNNSTYLNPNIEKSCAASGVDISSAGSTQSYTIISPRCEGWAAGDCIIFRAGSAGSVVDGAYSNAGTWASIVTDLGTNLLTGGVGTQADMAGFGQAPITYRCAAGTGGFTGVTCFSLNGSGDVLVNRKFTAGLIVGRGPVPTALVCGAGATFTAGSNSIAGQFTAGAGGCAIADMTIFNSGAEGFSCWANNATTKVALYCEGIGTSALEVRGTMNASDKIQFGILGW